MNRKYKNLIKALTLATTITVSFTAVESVSASIKPIYVTVDGNQVQFPDQQPVFENNRTLIPVRAVAEALGVETSFNAKTQIITFTKGSDIVKVTLGSKTAYKSGNVMILDVAAKSVKGRTYVPLRFIGEAFGAEVTWVGSQSLVKIIMNGSSVPSTPTNPTNPPTPTTPVQGEQNATFKTVSVADMKTVLAPYAKQAGLMKLDESSKSLIWYNDAGKAVGYNLVASNVTVTAPDSSVGKKAIESALGKLNVKLTPAMQSALNSSEKSVAVSENGHNIVINHKYGNISVVIVD